ncbi:MAG: hypothetical protein KatS3mg044_1498 [Rhodothermaceae bacterium]|nr:MAG: hypothetical protein KatS3mg044_1498 [Rhodothermaceae bacterium]
MKACILIAPLLLILMACQTMDTAALDSGVEGHVLRSPARPGPVRSGEANEAPFSATFTILDEEGRLVATFATDDDGYFRVSLPPGTYTLVPSADAPIMNPTSQQRTFTVTAGTYHTLRLVFDTGLR